MKEKRGGEGEMRGVEGQKRGGEGEERGGEGQVFGLDIQDIRRLREILERREAVTNRVQRRADSIETYDEIEVESYQEAGAMLAPGSSGSGDSGYRGWRTPSERGRTV